MSANVTLRASGDYEQPLFYAGQVLPDTELTQLALFSRSHTEAQARRSGWGVIYGLLPCKDGETGIALGAGVVVDRQGRLFVFETKDPDGAKLRIDDLIDDKMRGEIKQREDGKFDLDLWLRITLYKSEDVLPYQTIAGEGAYAPRIPPREKNNGSKDTAHVRAMRRIPTARLTLRWPDVLEDLIGEHTKKFDDFVASFNKRPDDVKAATDAGDAANEAAPKSEPEKDGGRKPDPHRDARLTALTALFAKRPAEYDGVPLGRVRIIKKGESLTVSTIDWAEGRRGEALDRPPAHPGHINVAPLFDLKPEQAESWLASRGIYPWRTVTLTGQDIADGNIPEWNAQLQPGNTARLYVRDGRVVVVRKGPRIADEFCRLRRYIGIVGLLLLFLMLLLFWILAAHLTGNQPT